jgi:thiosulfate reductase cytochrome b subunit
VLAERTPVGVSPAAGDGAPFEGGQIVTGSDGAVTFQPLTGSSGSQTYIFGYSSVKVVDLAGAILFLGTLAGATAHGGLRYFSAKRRARVEPEIEEHYMYSVYERLWHWLQTAAILLLVLTGLIIHKPDLFGMFSFAYMVQVHNILAAILVINAGLALFYHLASGQIRQYLPEPRGFFGQAILQAKFYLRGIFKGDAHPFEKTPERKLNPLQQITYLGLLNVLLPAQIISGALMWGVQRWPALANLLGGLPVLAPIHTLVAWLFASFVVMHVYLTTTGHEPLASMRGMVMGWDEVEVPGGAK